MQVPWSFRVLHPQDLLDEDANLPRRRRPSQRELRRRRQGHHLQRRQRLAARGRDHQTAVKGRPGVLRGLSQLLSPSEEGGVLGYPG